MLLLLSQLEGSDEMLFIVLLKNLLRELRDSLRLCALHVCSQVH